MKKNYIVNTPFSLSLDGDMWCALLGEDLQEGHSGFGETKEEALQKLFFRLLEDEEFSRGLGNYYLAKVFTTISLSLQEVEPQEERKESNA